MEYARRALRAIVEWAMRHPTEAILLVIFIARLFATTVQSGWVGVLFRFGRARRVIEPGFRWLIPGLEHVRKIHSKAITQVLPAQRIAIADGLVYDVGASLVYRVRDPMKAMIEIDDVTAGCATAGALAVWDVLRERRHDELRDRELLDEALTRNVRARIAIWGLDVDRAGFTTIAPTAKTIRLTQLEPLVFERALAMGALTAGGLSTVEALLLLGSDRKITSHAHARYRDRALRRPPPTIAARRIAEKLSEEEAAFVEEEIDALLSDEFMVTTAAEEALEKRGRVIVARLRERLRRVGDLEAAVRAEELIKRIEKAEKQKETEQAEEETE